MPAKPKKQSTRRPAKKVPSWHLTSEISMKYINDVSSRQAEKKKSEEKYEKSKERSSQKFKTRRTKIESESDPLGPSQSGQIKCVSGAPLLRLS